MTIEEAVEEIRLCAEIQYGSGIGGVDIESAHMMADSVLCQLLRENGFGAVVEAWSEVPKWYS